jgi:hypothetical protein
MEGVILRYRHAGLELGDIVLLWNAQGPSYPDSGPASRYWNFRPSRPAIP